MNNTITRIIAALAVVIILIISGYLLFESAENKIREPAQQIPAEKINPEVISGHWQRTDGEYMIEIRAAHNDGRLDASYFNPKPINVSISEWSTLDNRLNIFIELSDVNYPGSYYKLAYFPEQDQLIGTYYQAIYKQTYEIQFIRVQAGK